MSFKIQSKKECRVFLKMHTVHAFLDRKLNHKNKLQNTFFVTFSRWNVDFVFSLKKS
jgi:hypothetical protein